MTITNLTISTGVSRGQTTQGKTIVRLDDLNTGKRYECVGGGYDMVGAVFGDWLEDVHQAKLVAIAARALRFFVNSVRTNGDLDGFYGMTAYDNTSVSLQGGCGLGSMIVIAKTIGLDVQRIKDNNGRLLGFNVTEKTPL